MKAPAIASMPATLGETTLTGRNQVTLPAKGLRRLGWKRGDKAIVEAIGEDILVLIRRPARWTDAFAGRLTGVFGTHEENLGWIEKERARWEEEE